MRVVILTFHSTMKAAIVLAVLVGSAVTAPIEDLDNIEELLRAKKSSYGAPCGGAAPYATPVSLYLGPSSQPLYREEEHELKEEEHKGRSFYEPSIGGISAGHAYGASSGSYGGSSAGSISGGSASGYGSLPSASISYGGPAASASSGISSALAGSSIGSYSGSSAGGYGSVSAGNGASSLLSGVVHGPAVGLFPNAHVGGCNIPLLLSCAPNVIAGHLAQTNSYSAPAYRSFDDEVAMDGEQAMMAREASHHVVSQDYPEPHPGNHHVVSQDYPKPNLSLNAPIQQHKNDEHPSKS